MGAVDDYPRSVAQHVCTYADDLPAQRLEFCEPVDIASEDSLAQLVSTVGAVDHLVYTAGEALQLTRLADLTPVVIRRFWETRYIGAISVVRGDELTPVSISPIPPATM